MIDPRPNIANGKQVLALWDYLHRILVVIRQLGHEKQPELIAGLADLLHNLPLGLFDSEKWYWNGLELRLRDFGIKAK